MKYIFLSVFLTAAITSIAFAQQESERSVEQPIDFVSSPMMGFLDQENCPVDLKYVKTVKGNQAKNTVESILRGSSRHGQKIASFVVVCVETIDAKMGENTIIKKTHEISNNSFEDFSFTVNENSKLLFYVKSVELPDGTQWYANQN